MAALPEKPPTLKGTLMNRYVIQKELGSGGYGQIYQVSDTKKKGIVRVAKVVLASMTSTTRELKAMAALQDAKCENLCPLLHTFPFADRLVFVLPLMVGDLNTLRTNNKNNSFCKKTCLKVCWSMLNALEVMHKKYFLHRDIKPANIMLRLHDNNKKGYWVLIDFGTSTMFKDGESRTATNDYHFETGETSTFGMASGLRSSESDDLGMLGYTLMRIRNLEPRGRFPSLEQTHRQWLEKNPGEFLQGEKHVLLKIVQALFGQPYGKIPDYDQIRKVIKSERAHCYDPNGPVKLVRGRGNEYPRVR